MKWDDELERLSTAVVEAFGEQALNAAIQRAYGDAALLLQTESLQRTSVASGAADNPAGRTSFEEWFNTRQLLDPLGYMPPAEYEAR